jgi:DNA-binding NtrC family response regulator
MSTRRAPHIPASPSDSTDGLDGPIARREGPPYLVVFDGDCAGSFVLPKNGSVTVGRGETCDLRLTDRGASRSHAKITLEGGRASVEDIGSQNGTTVNGARVTARRELASGDTIEIGAAALVFHVPAGPAREPSAPASARPSDVRWMDAGLRRMLVADPAMVRMCSLIERVARADLPILIVGETGVGKELAAGAVHAASPRRGRPLLAINCAAVQESVFESELFGHERGAFTGAVQPKPGLLEIASGGTVFLDEVGELSAQSQAKLLRALDSKRVLRVGGLEERPIDVRIVAATNRDLSAEVAAGRFRQDLYFRLSGATLYLPPLRDRPRELALLSRAFLEESCTKLGRPAPELSDGFLAALAAHPFPGNVRELRNVMEYVAATADGPVLGVEHLADRLRVAPPPAPPAAASAPAGAQAAGFRPLDDEVRELEKGRMQAALLAAQGNQKRAAELIGMPLRTFQTKVRQYGLRDRLRRGR